MQQEIMSWQFLSNIFQTSNKKEKKLKKKTMPYKELLYVGVLYNLQRKRELNLKKKWQETLPYKELLYVAVLYNLRRKRGPNLGTENASSTSPDFVIRIYFFVATVADYINQILVESLTAASFR